MCVPPDPVLSMLLSSNRSEEVHGFNAVFVVVFAVNAVTGAGTAGDAGGVVVFAVNAVADAGTAGDAGGVVVVAVVRWTVPIALTAGNCVILKPSEKVPLTMRKVGQLLGEAG